MSDFNLSLLQQLLNLGGALTGTVEKIVLSTAASAEPSAALEAFTPYRVVADDAFHARVGTFGSTTAVD